MNATSYLEQLLKTGASALDQTTAGMQAGDGRKYATGAAVGGVLGLLLGSKSGRRMGGKALKAGSVVALGALAWKAYGDWQRQNAGASAGTSPVAAPSGHRRPRPVLPRLPAPQLEAHSRAMLKALIAAAKADGHMDEVERGQVETELRRLNADAETRTWVDTELRRVVDPADVAAAATGPEMAAEIYLASVLVVDDTTVMERAYLDELARRLQLAPGLKAELEARARQRPEAAGRPRAPSAPGRPAVSRRLQGVVQHLDPMPHRRGRAGLQMLDAADVGRHDGTAAPTAAGATACGRATGTDSSGCSTE